MAESANSPSLPSCSPSDFPTPLKLNLKLEKPLSEKVCEVLKLMGCSYYLRDPDEQCKISMEGEFTALL